MFFERIDLYNYFGKEREEGYSGYLNVYAPTECCPLEEPRKRPAILIIAGGGYGQVTKREQEPVAFKFMAEGFSAFTLEYTCVPNGIYPVQLLEACMAIAFIRENAGKYQLKEDKVCVAGFSAGGHLTSMLHCLYKEDVVKNYLGVKAELCRPDAVILGYSVIFHREDDPSRSVKSISGANEELCKYLCMDKRVHSEVCPAFIFTTFNDMVVPMEHSLAYANALRKNNIPFEMVVFEKGVHGVSTANSVSSCREAQVLPRVSKWVDQVIGWLKERDFKIDWF